MQELVRVFLALEKANSHVNSSTSSDATVGSIEKDEIHNVPVGLKKGIMPFLFSSVARGLVVLRSDSFREITCTDGGEECLAEKKENTQRTQLTKPTGHTLALRWHR